MEPYEHLDEPVEQVMRRDFSALPLALTDIATLLICFGAGAAFL